MPDLIAFSLINAKVNKYKDDFSLENIGVAFDWVALEIILALTAEEIEEVITDGYNDGGIDAIFTSNRDVHVFSFKYTTSFEKTNNNFPDNDLDKLLVTMDRIFNKSITKDDVNDALWEKISEIWDLFENDPLKGPLNFKFHICSNKLKPTDQAQRKFQASLDRYRYVEYFYYDQDELALKLLEHKYKKVDGTFKFIEKEYFQRSDGPLKGVVGTVAATDLMRLVEDPNNLGHINEDAFNDNARVYFKLKNQVNRNIYDTALSDENYKFWYLNNGITIVCADCSYTPNLRSPVVILKNFQIVNGGQTTHALFEAYLTDREKIDDVLVLVRICQTMQRNISEKISETTNSQTPVISRDLHANDRIQRYLEDEFITLGYFYERKKDQYANELKNKRLDNELLGQLYLAYYLNMPSEAKNSKIIVFGTKYNEIFNEDINASKLLLPYRIYLPIEEKKKEIQKKKRNKMPVNEKEAFISRATFHILNSVRVIAENENIDLNTNDSINRAIEIAIKYIYEKVDLEISKRGDLYTHDKFFKESTTSKAILEYISSKYPRQHS